MGSFHLLRGKKWKKKNRSIHFLKYFSADSVEERAAKVYLEYRRPANTHLRYSRDFPKTYHFSAEIFAVGRRRAIIRSTSRSTSRIRHFLQLSYSIVYWLL